jgi:hypothetical protein
MLKLVEKFAVELMLQQDASLMLKLTVGHFFRLVC